MKKYLTLLLILLLFPIALFAQLLTDYDSSDFVYDGPKENALFGSSVKGQGDFNGDGLSDLLVGAPQGGSHCEPNHFGKVVCDGAVFVYDGATGNLLHSLEGFDNQATNGSNQFGASVTAGDLNGDGYDEIIIGSPRQDLNARGAGLVYIFDGMTAELLRTHFCSKTQQENCGKIVESQCDINGDGFDDILISGSQVYIYSGVDGTRLGSPMMNATRSWGDSLTCLKDIDGDGHDEIAVGAPSDDQSATAAGSAHIINGKTMETLFLFYGNYQENFGADIEGIGDFNGDGISDLMVGAPGQTPSYAKIFSGFDGSVLAVLQAPFSEGSANIYFGGSLTELGDMNDDGYADVAIHAPGSGQTFLFSGNSGELLVQIDPFINEFGGVVVPERISSLPDMNADGLPDLAVGAPASNATASQAGRVYLFYSSTWGFTPSSDPIPEPEPEPEPDDDSPHEVSKKLENLYKRLAKAKNQKQIEKILKKIEELLSRIGSRPQKKQNSYSKKAKKTLNHQKGNLPKNRINKTHQDQTGRH